MKEKSTMLERLQRIISEYTDLPASEITEQTNIRRWIVAFYEVVSRGKHTTCSTRLISDCNDLAIVKNIITTLGQ